MALTYMGPSGLIVEQLESDAGYEEISGQVEDMLSGAGFLIPSVHQDDGSTKDVYVSPSPGLLLVSVVGDPDDMVDDSEEVDVDDE